MKRVVAIAVFAGCWANNPPPPPRSTDLRNTAPPIETPQPLPDHSVWTGRYECGQGVTALQLTLDRHRGGRATATFDFGPHADNPTVPAGAYRMQGRTFEDAGKIHVSLAPDGWLSQPDGYIMVGIEGDIDPLRRTLKGKIVYVGCDWVDLRRAD
jgi:hypothetical protein